MHGTLAGHLAAIGTIHLMPLPFLGAVKVEPQGLGASLAECNTGLQPLGAGHLPGRTGARWWVLGCW